MNKKDVQEAAIHFLQSKIDGLKIVLDDICNSTSEDSKSSAGDKHETATSMAQLEQEKISKQLQVFLNQRAVLDRIDSSKMHHKIETGSLILSNKGWFYFSTGLGMINIDNENVFCLALQSPIGELLKGKQKGESVVFNGLTTFVLEVF
jgi:hypothetical protein